MLVETTDNENWRVFIETVYVLELAS